MRNNRDGLPDRDILIEGDGYLSFTDRRSGRIFSDEVSISVYRNGRYIARCRNNPRPRMGMNDGIIQLMIEEFLGPYVIEITG